MTVDMASVIQISKAMSRFSGLGAAYVLPNGREYRSWQKSVELEEFNIKGYILQVYMLSKLELSHLARLRYWGRLYTISSLPLYIYQDLLVF